METYSIKQVSELIKMPKDTLRYYDKIGLVCPKRSDNRYRYYTAQDIRDLQYAEVMKFGGFTLAEIKQVFQYMRVHDARNYSELLSIFNKKKLELIRKQNLFGSMIEFMTQIKTLMDEKKDCEDIIKIDRLVENIFEELEGRDNEK
ncbi:transcriptional regulator [Clostridium zeae]|uniref:Transcriptional regulator n=1 Tax=Clostridium zeae TaxID=2759022 RepID=A0ABQ1E5X4_9CLOT|nr:MerR family transcriptional regulator [Clostridium zeae]GFZ30143.1 transcriptional regulator [Clostridium zeae]